MHIRLVMQLSDAITDRVVYFLHVLLNEWNDDDDEENDKDLCGFTLIHLRGNS